MATRTFQLYCDCAPDLSLTEWFELEHHLNECAHTHAYKVARVARKLAPYRRGELRRGIIALDAPEKAKSKGKFGYQVVMAYDMDDVFVKTRKDGKRYYYPASQEYGFLTRNRTVERRHVDGKYFMKRAATTGYYAFYDDVRKVIEEAVSD